MGLVHIEDLKEFKRYVFNNSTKLKKVFDLYYIEYTSNDLFLTVEKEKMNSDIINIKKVNIVEDSAYVEEAEVLNDKKIKIEPAVEKAKETTIQAFNGDMSKAYIRETLNVLAKKVNKNIVFCVPHTNSPYDDQVPNKAKVLEDIQKNDILYVFSYGPWVDDDNEYTDRFDSGIFNTTLFGISATTGDRLAVPKEGFEILMDTDGRNICTMHHSRNVFFIPVDICHDDNFTSRKLFKKIIDLIDYSIHFDASAELKKRKEELEKNKEIARGKFVNTIMNSSKSVSRSLGGEASNVQADITKLKAELVNKIERLEDIAKELLLIKSGDVEREKINTMYDILYKNEKIHFIETEGNIIKAITKKLYFTDEKTGIKHYAGVFSIKLDMNMSAGGKPEIINLHFKIDGYSSGMQAPHIFPGGAPCMGNLEKQLPFFLMAYEIDMAVGLLINFIESINQSDGAGKLGYRWPIALYDNQSEETKRKYKSTLDIQKSVHEFYGERRTGLEESLKPFIQ